MTKKKQSTEAAVRGIRRRTQATLSVRGGGCDDGRRSWEFAPLNSTAHGTRGQPSHFTRVATSVGLQISWVTPTRH
jgi:hypothetical protein